MEHGGIYHKNRRFLLAFLMLSLVFAGLLVSTRGDITLSPEEEQVFVSQLVPGEICRCVYINPDLTELAQENMITITSIEQPEPSQCLQQEPCTIEVNLNQGNGWQSQTIIGTSAYTIG